MRSGRIANQASAGGFDYAGQTVYYAVHQLFLSQRGINLIVMDASKDFDAAIDDENIRHIGKLVVGNSKDFFKFWAKSFRYYLPKQTEKRIIIVFTHTDLVDNEEEIEIKKALVLEIVESMKMQRMFFDRIFCVNARNPNDKELQDLRDTTLYLTEGTDTWGNEMPSLWLLLEDKLMKMKSEGVRVMKLDEVEQLNENSDHKLKSRSEIFLFLKIHHEIGTLIHYADERLQEIVILDAQWLIDSLKTIIAAKRFLNMTYKEEWGLLHDKGILYHKFMEKVWQEQKDERFYEFKDELLYLMNRSDLIASPKFHSDQSHLSYCIVPCMLRNAPEDFLGKYKQQCTSHNQSLVYEFEYGFLPTATVYRLLAACIDYFGESVDSNGSMFCDASRGTIFCNAAAFRVEERHYLLLEISPSSVIITMTAFAQEHTDRQVCYKTRLFLTRTLEDIIANQKASSHFTIKMPCCTTETFILLNWEDLNAKPQIICDKHSPEPPHSVNSEQLLQNWMIDKEMEGNRRHLQKNSMAEGGQSNYAGFHKQTDAAVPWSEYCPHYENKINRSIGFLRTTAIDSKGYGTCFRVGQQRHVMTAYHVVHSIIDNCVVQIARRIVQNSKSANKVIAMVAKKLNMKIPHTKDEHNDMEIILRNYLTLTKPEYNISNLLSELEEIIPRDVLQKLIDALNTYLWKDACTVKFEENDTLFSFEYDIPFADKDNDIIIMKVAGNKRLPKPVVLDVSEPPKEVNIFGFTEYEQLYVDMKCPVFTDSKSERKAIERAKEWWVKDSQFGQSRQYVDEHFGRTENRVILHTSPSFEHGTSGSPVTRVDQQSGLPLVCMMYQCGYPAFYYRDQHQQQVPRHVRFEGGVSTKFVAKLISDAGMNWLKSDLFSQDDKRNKTEVCVVV